MAHPRIPLFLLPLLAAPLAAAPQGSDLSPTGLPALFGPSTGTPLAGVGLDPAAIRQRVVTVDLDLLRDTLGRTQGTGAILLNLFPDDQIPAFLDHVESAPGGYVWVGSLEGAPDSSVLFSVVGNTVSGTVRFGPRLFRLYHAGNGQHRLSEAEDSRFQPCGQAAPQVVLSPPSPAPAPGSGGARGGNPDIDVMVVYTTQAKNGQGGTSAMQSLINLAVTETNQAYTNSGVNQRLVLVHSEEMTGYTEPSSFSTMLNDLTGTNDGKLDNVHSLRDQYGADCVSMLVNGSQYCGIAWLMTNVSHSFQSNAFSVVARTCATGYYSFGHELGHNMGSAHDPQNAGSAAYNYSYGFRTSDNKYRTVMAYSPGTRVKYFSSPNVTYRGYTMGTNSQDNARSLNNTAATVAGFRNTVPPTPVLTVPALIPNLPAILDVTNCVPNGTVYIAYSTVGGGPTNTQWGSAALTPPYTPLSPMTADSAGNATQTVTVPGGTSGVPVWFQAVDLAAGLLSNGVATTVN